MIYLSTAMRPFVLFLGLMALTVRPALATDSTYLRFHTSLGNIDVLMLSDEAPHTVAQFMSYLNSGVLTDSIFHRAATNLDPDLGIYVPFVIQGGGYYLPNDMFPMYELNPPATQLLGEPGVSNTPGTLAMALSNGPDSATNQWYFNAADNSSLLDGTVDGGPFTVFGTSTNISSLAVIEMGALTPVYDAHSVFNNDQDFVSLPLITYDSSVGLVPQDFFTIFSITPLTVQTFSAWQNTYFPGRQNGDGAATAIPLNDGVQNILKFLCHIDPTTTMTAADHAKLPKLGRTSITTVVNGSNVTTNYITLTYQQRDAIAGVVVNLQTSTDLKTWTTQTSPFVAESGTDATTGDPIVTYRAPTTTGTDLFLRLNITMP